jgi:hypothetical protein
MKTKKLSAGARVIVRSPEEILATLDGDGALHGLPFMPEMLDWCGKTFRVERRVEKTCVDVPPSIYPNRRFAANDVVFLEGPRCDGRGHDGCKRGCKIFWKEDWLRPVDSADTSSTTSARGAEALRSRLRTKSDASHYVCQSTRLLTATEAFPGRKKPWMLRIVFREVRNGELSLPELLKLSWLWAWHRLLRRAHGDSLRTRERRPDRWGSNRATPSASRVARRWSRRSITGGATEG